VAINREIKKISLSKSSVDTPADTEPEYKRRMKRGVHSRKDGWKTRQELSTNLDYIKIADEGRIYEKA